MPNLSNVSGSLRVDRQKTARELYLDRGAAEACNRCDVNARFGARDFGDELVRWLELTPGETVVDVGCGTGQHLLRFASEVGGEGRVLGFDFNPDAVAKTIAMGANAQVADGAQLPLETGSVDVLCCNFAIYYLPDLPQALREWARVLREGGRLLVSGPAEDTNSELYTFHRQATGLEPSDVDRMALGFVAGSTRLALSDAGFLFRDMETFANPIRFPGVEEFLAYWQSTSLFVRSVQEPERQMKVDAARALLQARPGEFVVTKRVSILRAIRR